MSERLTASLFVRIRGPKGDLQESDLVQLFGRHCTGARVFFKIDHAFVHVPRGEAADVIRRTNEVHLRRSTLLVAVSKRSREEDDEGERSEKQNPRIRDSRGDFERFCNSAKRIFATPTMREMVLLVCADENVGSMNMLASGEAPDVGVMIFRSPVFCSRVDYLIRNRMLSEADAGRTSGYLLKFFHTTLFDASNLRVLEKSLTQGVAMILEGVLNRFGPEVIIERYHRSLGDAASSIMYLTGTDQAASLLQVRVALRGLASHMQELARIRETAKGLAPNLPISVEEESDLESVKSVVAIDDQIPAQPSFRVKCVVPLFSELAFSNPPQLRPIEVGKALSDLDDHLDRVFHLAREDALRDLRSALNHIRLSRPSDGVSFKGFADLRFSHISANESDGIVFVFQSDALRNLVSRNPKATEKRVIRGSLVIVSSNSFREGVTGVVSDSTREARAQGYISIWFTSILQSSEQFLSVGKLGNVQETFSLLESEVYWEAYSHPLRALQQLRWVDTPTIQNVLCQKNNTDAVDTSHFQLQHFQRQVAFDSSQAAAFEFITKSASPIIQGPPGTGKSFVGVCAVRSMLHATSYRGNPIIVVCYTNHALDDFLSDLISKENDFFLKQDDRGDTCANPGTLIRIGQRSKNPLIKEFCVRGGVRRVEGEFGEKVAALARAWNSAVDASMLPTGDPLIELYFQDRLQMARSALSICEKQLDEAEGVFVLKAGPHAKDVHALLSGLRIAERLTKTRARVGDAAGSLVQCVTAAMRRSLKSSPELTALERIYQIIKSPVLTVARKCEQEWHRFNALDSRRKELKAETRDVFGAWRDEKGDPPKIRKMNPDSVYFSTESDADLEGLTLRRSNVDSLDDCEEEDTFLSNDFTFYGSELPASIVRCTSRQDTFRVLGSLTPIERHQFYGHYRRIQFEKFLSSIRGGVSVIEQSITRKVANHTMLGHLQHAQVIGATTTGLARMLPLMQQLSVQCVLLEEAAEIPEHHALAALLPDCPKFIQIGDHQQLRPKFQVYDLKRYNINISLMERMLSHNNQCRTLSIQRRMRTEICNFVRPFYAKRLAGTLTGGIVDHPSIINYPECPSEYGLDMSKGWVLWLNHSFSEEAGRNGSYANRPEAEMAVALAWYLSKQRPEASITVLVPYSGQCLVADSIVRARYRALLDNEKSNVRIATVDDFQGEESDVIILSLTRSHRIGFLGEDNRVCVALSRARHLQIVIGNFSVFERAGSELWQSLLDKARLTPNGVGETLSLYCRRHNASREVRVTSDSYPLRMAVSEGGGCFAKCRRLMGCGHVCEAQCHADVACDESFTCREPCGRVRKCGHPCKNMCGKDCGECDQSSRLRCECGGLVDMQCRDVGSTCNGYLEACTNEDALLLPCGHVLRGPCNTVNSAEGKSICRSVCGFKLPCGHTCPASCTECFKDGKYNHGLCALLCTRTLSCGHLCSSHVCSSGICPSCKTCSGASFAAEGFDSASLMRAWERQASGVAAELLTTMIDDAKTTDASSFFIPEIHATLMSIDSCRAKFLSETAHSYCRTLALFILYFLSRKVRKISSARMQMMQGIREIYLLESVDTGSYDLSSASGDLEFRKENIQSVARSLKAVLRRVFLKLSPIEAENQELTLGEWISFHLSTFAKATDISDLERPFTLLEPPV